MARVANISKKMAKTVSGYNTQTYIWIAVIVILLGIILYAVFFNRTHESFADITEFMQGDNGNDYNGYKDEDEVPRKDKFMNDEDPSLVMFYADWCGFCKQVKPEFTKFKDELKSMDTRNKAIMINSDEHPELMRKFRVNSFPTFKFFPRGMKNGNPIDYQGGRDSESFMKFINENSGGSRRTNKTESGDGKPEFVMFYGDYCGHCQRAKPKFLKFKELAEKEGDISVKLIDTAQNSELMSKYDIQGVPSFKYFPNGMRSDEVVDYEGPREVESWMEFIKSQ